MGHDQIKPLRAQLLHRCRARGFVARRNPERRDVVAASLGALHTLQTGFVETALPRRAEQGNGHAGAASQKSHNVAPVARATLPQACD
ncbi:hypothetical protein D3C71_1760390 [compost metagenome]